MQSVSNSLSEETGIHRKYLAINAEYPVVAARKPDDEEHAEYQLRESR